jgi:hypothetical protein
MWSVETSGVPGHEGHRTVGAPFPSSDPCPETWREGAPLPKAAVSPREPVHLYVVRLDELHACELSLCGGISQPGFDALYPAAQT